ncbi:hypothetical protein JTE90_025591 [Oedothorax gibbosus]|uniref:LITAF domain-containing protein n=1 Tax=Oedothorax gibbosus TaxID=931172 RepID=A0AAV6U3U2_9ARAC|nr:hypothetical protein JTE90_025591 [Oedothorax gibbosus]
MQPIESSYPTAPHCIVLTPPAMLSTGPMHVTCGNCRRTVLTSVTKENGACAYVATLFVCLICCPFFWLPLCMESCKDVHHSCPSCGARFGTYKKI